MKSNIELGKEIKKKGIGVIKWLLRGEEEAEKRYLVNSWFSAFGECTCYERLLSSHVPLTTP